MGSVPVSRAGLPVVNTNTDRIYLAGKNGVIQCLREQGRRWPIARKPEASAKKPTENVEVNVDEPATQADPVPSEEQPSAMDEQDGGFFDDSEEDVVDEGIEEDPMEDDGSDPFADDGGGFGDESGDAADDGEDPFF